MTRRTPALLALTLLAGLAPLVPVEPAAAATTSSAIVSRATSGAQIDGSSEDPALSADGRYVAFATDAEFYPGDDNGTIDVFRKDLLTGTIVPVSVDDDGVFGDTDSYNPSISADGRFVAFLSDSDELDTYDGNDRDQNLSTDLYYRDMVDLETRPAVLFDVPGDGDAISYTPVDGVYEGMISRDGKHVVFSTDSTLNTTEPIDDFDTDVYVRTLGANVYRRLSRNPANNSAGGGDLPTISADGRFVAFASTAIDLTGANDSNGVSDVFVVDRDADDDAVFDEAGAVTIARASNDTGGNLPNGASSAPFISATGRYIAFVSQATDLGGAYGGVYLRDRQTATNTWVSPTFLAPDGTFLSPSVSDDGRFVAFSSSASGLVAGDSPGSSDVFRRDRTLAVTERVTSGNAGAQPDGQSFDPVVGASGLVVTYASGATNLVPTDTNLNDDVFVWAPLNDLSAPAVTMRRPASRWAVNPELVAEWYGFDTSTVGSYDVQRRIATFNAGLPAWTATLTNTAATQQSLTGATGRTYCWRMRAEDIHGNVSGYTSAACTAVPLPTSSLVFSSGWTAFSGSQYYGGRAMRATTTGRTITRTNVVAERIALVVSTCNGCGSVRVTFGSSTKTVSLQSSTTQRKRMIEVFSYSSPRTSTLRIQTTANKPVVVEGLGIYKD